MQKENVRLTAQAISQLAENNQLVICHGNGPQVGLLALQNLSYKEVKPYPLDVLDAQTQGMIGYLIQSELDNALTDKKAVTLLTQVCVDKNDPAFKNPTKPVGPVYNKEEAEAVASEHKWQIAQDGKYYRRVVPSPKPSDIVELDIARQLLEEGNIVIFGGGGGIPVVKNESGKLVGVEAVIDKDNTASLIAQKLGADMLIILTDVSAACIDFGTPSEKRIKNISPSDLKKMNFAKGSMGPKIEASCNFVNNTNKRAAIGKLSEVQDIIDEKAGTQIKSTVSEITYY